MQLSPSGKFIELHIIKAQTKGVKIVPNIFGIGFQDEKFIAKYNECCPLYSTLLGKSSADLGEQPIMSFIANTNSLDQKYCWGFAQGFDGNIRTTNGPLKLKDQALLGYEEGKYLREKYLNVETT